MSDYINLLGADDVRSAGRTIASAAGDMRSAASAIESTMDRHQRFLDDWLARLEAVMQPQPQPSARDIRGHAAEFAGADIVVTTTGEVVKSKDDNVRVLVIDHLTRKTVR